MTKAYSQSLAVGGVVLITEKELQWDAEIIYAGFLPDFDGDAVSFDSFDFSFDLSAAFFFSSAACLAASIGPILDVPALVRLMSTFVVSALSDLPFFKFSSFKASNRWCDNFDFAVEDVVDFEDLLGTGFEQLPHAFD